jgi:hypothetical protein|uniref:Uncharacterized protein n=1 Tax=Siphoviridae sp. ctWdm1 TaxID=2827883 RepID=A0A8S5RXV2_9CAUD|nr:MAG: hypothetical protein [Bacteriophage sp.]DAD60121.1 MAG TPA: hypothetical protein [Caudoviricetes sp.]DAF43596.1 MAG TPA: hypothetical protein [Siphoviridae sp. ctWdm1]DAO63146.1 MAG TPA: hypothetical protein [Caudoviricetes sp.]
MDVLAMKQLIFNCICGGFFLFGFAVGYIFGSDK